MTRRSRAAQAYTLDALTDLTELVVVGVRSGLGVTGALREAGNHADPRLRPALDEVWHRLDRGFRLADAISALPDVLGPSAAGLADSLATADRYGLPLEPVLERLATDVRDDRRRQSERHARSLPVKLSFPLVVCTLPAFVLLAIVPAVLGALSTLRGQTP